MVTKPVTLKALLRVCADLVREDAEPVDGRVKRWEKRPKDWTEAQRRACGLHGNAGRRVLDQNGQPAG